MQPPVDVQILGINLAGLEVGNPIIHLGTNDSMAARHRAAKRLGQLARHVAGRRRLRSPEPADLDLQPDAARPRESSELFATRERAHGRRTGALKRARTRADLPIPRAACAAVSTVRPDGASPRSSSVSRARSRRRSRRCAPTRRRRRRRRRPLGTPLKNCSTNQRPSDERAAARAPDEVEAERHQRHDARARVQHHVRADDAGDRAARADRRHRRAGVESSVRERRDAAAGEVEDHVRDLPERSSTLSPKIHR